MTEDDELADYYAYLLRLWRADDALDSGMDNAQRTPWRVSLESARTGERQAFGSLDGLLDYLREQTGTLSDTQNPNEERSNEE